jgi:acetyltransferase-like isoleucine patch superfamily enzyme
MSFSLTLPLSRRRSALALEPLAPAPATTPSVIQACRELEHNAPISEMLAEALARDIAERIRAAGMEAEWPVPKLSDLRVRRDGLPEAWRAGGNLLLAGPGAAEIQPAPWLAGLEVSNSLVALGAHARLHRLTATGDNAMLVLGDQVNLFAGTINIHARSTILLGEQTSATFDAQLDSRNGGAILVGADGMWAHGARMMTDDMHTIRDLKSGKRLNAFGGRIVIEPHVWLGEHVQVLGGSRIGGDGVVGIGSLVKGVLPPNCISVGRPAHPVRRGVTWSREDTP